MDVLIMGDKVNKIHIQVKQSILSILYQLISDEE